MEQGSNKSEGWDVWMIVGSMVVSEEASHAKALSRRGFCMCEAQQGGSAAEVEVSEGKRSGR